MLTQIDRDLYLDLDSIMLIEREPGSTGIVVWIRPHTVDSFDGPTAANILNAVERPARRRRRLLVRLDGWLRRALRVQS